MGRIRLSSISERPSGRSVGRWIAVWLIGLAVLAAGHSATAQDVNDSLFLPALGARSTAMGGTGVASTVNLSTTILNPAALVYFNPYDASVDYRFFSRRINQLAFQGIPPWPWIPADAVVGIGGDVSWGKRRVWPGAPWIGQNWVARANLVGARFLSPQLSVGAEINVYGARLYENGDGALALSLGGLYVTEASGWGLNLGAVARDLNAPKLDRGNDEVTLERTLLLGVAGSHPLNDTTILFRFAVDGEINARDLAGIPYDDLRVGVELDGFELRGMRFAGRLGTDFRQLTMGAGIRWSYLKIDWSKTLPFDGSDFTNGHSFSVMADCRELFDRLFGGGVAINWRDSLPVYRSEQYRRYQQAAIKQIQANRLDSAAVLLQTARAFADSSYQRAQADSALSELRRDLDRLSDETREMVRAELDNLWQARLADTIATKHSQLIAQADSCLLRHDYETALDLLNLVLAENPTDTVARERRTNVERARELEIVFNLVLADGAEKNDQLGEALEAYSQVLRLDSTHTDGVAGRTRIEDKLEARRLAGRALRLYEQSEPDGALAALDSAVLRDPSLRRVRDFLVVTYHSQPDTVSLEVIKNDSAIYVYYIQGLQFRSNHEYQRAMEAFSRVLEKYPNSPEVQRVYDEALELLNKSSRDSTTP